MPSAAGGTVYNRNRFRTKFDPRFPVPVEPQPVFAARDVIGEDKTGDRVALTVGYLNLFRQQSRRKFKLSHGKSTGMAGDQDLFLPEPRASRKSFELSRQRFVMHIDDIDFDGVPVIRPLVDLE